MSLERLRNTFAPRHRGTEGSRACKASEAEAGRDVDTGTGGARLVLTLLACHQAGAVWLGRRAGREAGREGASCV